MATTNSTYHTNLTIKRRFCLLKSEQFQRKHQRNGADFAQLNFSEMSRNKTSLPLRTSQRSVGSFLLIKRAPAFIETPPDRRWSERLRPAAALKSRKCGRRTRWRCQEIIYTLHSDRSQWNYIKDKRAEWIYDTVMGVKEDRSLRPRSQKTQTRNQRTDTER